MFRGLLALSLCTVCPLTLTAQGSPQNTVGGFLASVENTASLTANGSPFHAEMKIAGANNEPHYTASVTLDWASATQYRIEVRSPQFHQIETVAGGQIQAERQGDFYPEWLHAFVLALTDPLFIKPVLLSAPQGSLGGSRSSGPSGTQLCLNRNDRPGGITDQMTWSGMCAASDGVLTNTHNFNVWMDYSDPKGFAGKKIARAYSTRTGSSEEIKGRLTTLRVLTSEETNGIRVTTPTPASERIGFAFISTQAEEARVESVKPFQWPAVREGKTEGFMIVHAVTDTTGQVRETSKHNSDNPGLEEAGRQAALGYKFKPMLVDGVPVQIEMPLVLHFSSRVEDPLPVLRGADLLKQIHGCNAKLVSAPPSGPNVTPTHISVNEQGKLTGEGFGPTVDAGTPAVVVTLPAGIPHALGLDCQFAPLQRNGVITYYHGDLLVLQSR